MPGEPAQIRAGCKDNYRAGTQDKAARQLMFFSLYIAMPGEDTCREHICSRYAA